MVQGKHTNTVYLSKKFYSDQSFTKTCSMLITVLNKHGIKYNFLKSTNDIWCRDYMPIQKCIGNFVQFRYEPTYLINDLELRTDTKKVCEANNIEVQFSNINLDGGNVINWSNRAIITNRVFDENPEYSSKIKLISEIEKLLDVEIIVIPQIKSDMTGHADGLVRFVDRNILLGIDRRNTFKYWRSGIYKVLREYGFDYIDVPFFDYKAKKYPENAIGCYVNYLEVQNLIVLPIFETKNNKDKEAYDILTRVFPERNIETINYYAVGLLGGLINCTTWTIEE